MKRIWRWLGRPISRWGPAHNPTNMFYFFKNRCNVGACLVHALCDMGWIFYATFLESDTLASRIWKHDSRPWQKALMKPSATLADFVKVRVAAVGILYDTVSLSHIFGHDSAYRNCFDVILYQSSEEKIMISNAQTWAQLLSHWSQAEKEMQNEDDGTDSPKRDFRTGENKANMRIIFNLQDFHGIFLATSRMRTATWQHGTVFLEMDSSNLWHLCHRSEACAGFVNIHGWQGTALNRGLATTADWVPTSGEHEKSVGSSANVALPKWRVSPKWWSFRECSVSSHCFLCWGDVLQCFTHIAKEFWKRQS